MKKGINAWCFPENMAMEEMFKLAKANKYEGIELNMTEGGPAPTTDGGDCGAILELSERYGLPVYSVSTNLHWKYPLTAECEETREKGVQIVRKMIDAAKALGADTVLVVPGLVTESVSYKQAWERSAEALCRLKGYAEDNGVSIGVENVWNKFLLSPLEMRRFVEEINSPRVGVYFDAGNVLQFSYPEHWVEILGALIVKVHIKDFDASIGNISGFKPLLQGDMNWGRLMAALKSAGYGDYITAELSPYNANPAQLVEDTSRAMDYILSL